MHIFRGFIKYKREKLNYRLPEERINDYDEIYDHHSVSKTLKVQTARYCIIFSFPFKLANCHSKFINIFFYTVGTSMNGLIYI